METLTKVWQPTAAYLYVLHLDAAALAWEYLRRNGEYHRHWAEFGQRCTPLDARKWGLRFAEDPALDSRIAQPQWLANRPSLLRLTDHEECDDDEPLRNITFSLWAIPGHKALFHDGRRELLTVRVNQQTVRLLLAPEVQEGRSFAFAISAMAAPRASCSAISQAAALFSPSCRFARNGPTASPSQQSVQHMRTLQALDGELAGATQREIAKAIFGAQDVFERWETNSELRAQVRYLLRRGRMLVNGGYQDLLTKSSPTREGETHEAPDSP